MTTLSQITLENEMDLTLAYKKSMRTAELLGLTLATQTAFSTAVSEVCREVIDKASNGSAAIGVAADSGRFSMTAVITCETGEYFSRSSEGIEYARKLIPVLEITAAEEKLTITLKLGIPRSTQIDQRRVNAVKIQLEQEGPISAYDEIKTKNRELLLLNQQKELALLNANYLNEKKTEFLSVAAHELNTPLTVLRSYTELAERMNAGKDTKLSETLQKIHNQSSKVVGLVRQLLDISKLENGAITYIKERTDWAVFLEGIIEPLRLAVPKHQLLIGETPTAGLLIDRLRIEQVLNNVIGNASKYSSPEHAIRMESHILGGELIIQVTDKGIGMSAEAISNIFDKFYRANNAVRFNGLGMGLYIASKIVSDHGGRIDVTSAEGEGSTFSVYLPLA